MMDNKKKFKDTKVGQVLLGAAKVINPGLGSVLEGVLSPADAIAEITKAQISVEDKIKLQTVMVNAQQDEEKELTKRLQADQMSDSFLSKNVRPAILIWCIVIFSLAGILDSIESIPFMINELWNDTFEKVMMSVVGFYFGGRTIEKFKSMSK